MKALVLAIAAVTSASGFALARAADVRDNVQGHDPTLMVSDSQAIHAVSRQEGKIAMGPTSAPQKPGGTGGVDGAGDGPTGHDKKAGYRNKQHSPY